MHPELAALLAQPIAHRGLHGCGRPGPVENSLGAARAAIDAGYGIECDVLLSRDGEAMVFHDEDLTRLTGHAGQLADMDATALARLRLAGTSDHVPTLAELLSLIAGRTPLVIEIKSAGDGDMRLVERTLAVIADYRGPVAVESFDPAVLQHAKTRGAPRPIGLVGPARPGDMPPSEVVAATDFLSWSIDELAGIATCFALPRTTWTVRTEDQARHAGVHGAQIVFEGFTPSRGVKREQKASKGLSL